MTGTSTDDVVKRRKDDLLAAVRSADRGLDSIRNALADLSDHTDAKGARDARVALRQAEASLNTITEIAHGWGAVR